jgi:hypothetical protein
MLPTIISGWWDAGQVQFILIYFYLFSYFSIIEQKLPLQ